MPNWLYNTFLVIAMALLIPTLLICIRLFFTWLDHYLDPNDDDHMAG